LTLRILLELAEQYEAEARLQFDTASPILIS
jgi:hypothetical protein